MGGFIGGKLGRDEFVRNKIQRWVNDVHCLSDIAITQPQAAYAAMTKSLQFEWNYLQRVVPSCEELYADLEHVLANEFLPAVFGGEITMAERDLFSLPARMGGLGISNPMQTAHIAFCASRDATQIVVGAVKNECGFDIDTHEEAVYQARIEDHKLKDKNNEEKYAITLPKFGLHQQRAIQRAKDNKLSSWLTVIPVEKSHFDLSAREFRDGLALRYKRPLCLPTKCDGCGFPFSIEHALNCRKGGLVSRRHNEIRDAVGDLASLAWGQVIREPVVQEADFHDGQEALVADLAVRGVWQPQAEALFDVRVTDTDAQSYLHRSPKDVLTTAENEKKKKYSTACEERRANFTPLCVSVDGMLGSEADFFFKRLGDHLARKWEKSYSQVMGWVRARLSFAILRATNLCVRGSRTKWRSLGIEDGAGIQ